MSATTDRLVDDYLRDLRKELADLPRANRQEVLAEIDEHITEALSEAAENDEVAVRNVLDRLGDPVTIANDARERFGIRPPRGGWREIAAVVLLPIGGVIVPVVGWFVGLILLWASEVWTTRQKLLGTLVVPGGLLVPLYLGMALTVERGPRCSGSVDRNTGGVVHQVCTGPSGPSTLEQAGWILFFAFLVIGPIVVAILLARWMRRPAVYA
jgi:hypothetical protein